jgi:Fur family ferric uptake transcriptional regulator
MKIKLRVSRATLYNTINYYWTALWFKHQFGQTKLITKNHISTNNTIIFMTDTEEVIEFCDPRIQIKSTIEEIFDIEITNHALYFYGLRLKSDSDI